MAIRNVTIVGASGIVGTSILEVLASSGKFTLTLLKRKSSRSTPAVPVRTVEVSDEWKTEELTHALAGADAVVACFPVRSADDHINLANAAFAAGVQRFIPADFGSCDSRDPRVRRLLPLFERKVQIRERLEALAAQSEDGRFSWTSIVCGHLFDWGLREGFLHVDLAGRKVEILDDGKARSSTSMLSRTAEAVLRTLQLPEDTRNRVLMIQSFCVSQLDILRSLEKTSGQKWSVEYLDSESFIEERKTAADGGDKQAVEDLVFALGVVDGNWEEKPDFAMSLLGLQNETLDEAVQQVLSNR